MTLKDKLSIILITYNRAEKVKKTFEQFFFEGSPVADCDFIVQDNNSGDNTKDIVEEYSKKFPNIRYTKNRYNLGLSGTIARAMEVAEKEYVWIIGDDDKFDFSNWDEVENAINNSEKMICLARYGIPDEQKTNPAYQLFQLTFITGGIYSTSLFDDTTIRNAFANIYTMFSHIPPIIKLLNDGGHVYVVNKPIADNGMNQDTDCSFLRGVKRSEELYERTREMTWVLGYANIISQLSDKELQQECMKIAIPHKHIYQSWENFYYCVKNQFIDSGKINYFLEIYKMLPAENKKQLQSEFLKTKILMSLYF